MSQSYEPSVAFPSDDSEAVSWARYRGRRGLVDKSENDVENTSLKAFMYSREVKMTDVIVTLFQSNSKATLSRLPQMIRRRCGADRDSPFPHLACLLVAAA
jgi:hypothetical protein